jgi:2-aminoethylphosphonate-pyruvate transaminase
MIKNNMKPQTTLPLWKDKALFTPGPLTTSPTVKQAMLRDLGSRDTEFIALVREIRHRLVELGGVTEDEYTAIPMQGSGTFGLEAVVSSTIPPDGKLLVLINGAYGRRIRQIAEVLKIPVTVLEYPEHEPVRPNDVATTLASDPAITHVNVCHCETTSGLLNPVKEIGTIVREASRIFFVDAMSSFGVIPINLAECSIDYLVSSANKCIEGVPGFSFILAKLATLKQTEGYARSLSFDLLGQYVGLERNGQFRFTPPTHVLNAFYQALVELSTEGGIEARLARYSQNHHILLEGMQALGFKPYLDPDYQSPIITSFCYPEHPNFTFEEFYNRLNAYGYVIYPGKLGKAACFRIGTIGRIFPSDIHDLLAAIHHVLREMSVEM